MTTITAVELRNKLEEIIDLINSTGQEIVLNYRGSKKIRLVPYSKIQTKTNAQKIIEYFGSEEYDKKLKKYNLNIPELDENNPKQEKNNIKYFKNKKYE